VIVVDAGLALRWFLERDLSPEGTAALDYVGEHGASVPGNFHTEVAQGFIQAERRQRMGATDVAAALSDLMSLSLTVDLPDTHVIVATAREHGLTGHDAAYLALALKLNLPLATVDEALRAAARSAKILWEAR
jgi:predicted nucleic acid-binding protein